jgi:hypothetical protein
MSDILVIDDGPERASKGPINYALAPSAEHMMSELIRANLSTHEPLVHRLFDNQVSSVWPHYTQLLSWGGAELKADHISTKLHMILAAV